VDDIVLEMPGDMGAMEGDPAPPTSKGTAVGGYLSSAASKQGLGWMLELEDEDSDMQKPLLYVFRPTTAVFCPARRGVVKRHFPDRKDPLLTLFLPLSIASPTPSLLLLVWWAAGKSWTLTQETSCTSFAASCCRLTWEATTAPLFGTTQVGTAPVPARSAPLALPPCPCPKHHPPRFCFGKCLILFPSVVTPSCANSIVGSKPTHSVCVCVCVCVRRSKELNCCTTHCRSAGVGHCVV
jgi:hypothetical protein